MSKKIRFGFCIILLIGLIFAIISCNSNNSITGFAVLDENATNETSNESAATTETAASYTINETIADDTKEKKEKEEKE